MAVARGAAHPTFQFRAPCVEALPVGRGFEAAEERGGEQPAGLLEIGPVGEFRTKLFEFFQRLALHHLVQNIACVEGGEGIVAIRQIAQVLEAGRSPLG